MLGVLGVGEGISRPVHGVGRRGSRINRAVLAANALIPDVLFGSRSRPSLRTDHQRKLEPRTRVHCINNRSTRRAHCLMQIDGERASVRYTAYAIGQRLLVDVRPACCYGTRRAPAKRCSVGYFVARPWRRGCARGLYVEVALPPVDKGCRCPGHDCLHTPDGWCPRGVLHLSW